MKTTLAHRQTGSGYRWVMLILAALTSMTVITLPNMSLPPMFATISRDLNLTLVEVGMVWGMVSFTGIFFALIGGTIGDRFGARVTLSAAAFLSGLFGLTRAFAVDLPTLLLSSLAFGIFQAGMSVMLFKIARQWFPTEQLGMASGVISAGFAGGLMLGPLISTSVILPALGGWRQVLIFYGVLAIIISLCWLILHPVEKRASGGTHAPLLTSLRHVMGLKRVWVLGIGGLGVVACFQGFSGYLPTYLKAIGWAELDADRALSAFFLTSLIAVVPMSTMSDRLRFRRGFLVFASLVLAVGVGLLSVVEGALIVVVIALTGFVFDSFMAIVSASVLETEGVGYVYAGTAFGFASTIRNLGGTFSPALGNSLTTYGYNIPFLFWSAMALFGAFMFAFVLKSQQVKAAEVPTIDAAPISAGD